MSRVMVEDFIKEQAEASGNKIPGFKVRVISHERIRVMAKTVLTTTIDNDGVLYEVIHNIARNEAYINVYRRTNKQRVSHKAFTEKHPEYEINPTD